MFRMFRSRFKEWDRGHGVNYRDKYQWHCPVIHAAYKLWHVYIKTYKGLIICDAQTSIVGHATCSSGCDDIDKYYILLKGVCSRLCQNEDCCCCSRADDDVGPICVHIYIYIANFLQKIRRRFTVHEETGRRTESPISSHCT